MKKMLGMILVVAAALPGFSALVMENFDYSEGSLDGKTGGSGFASAWANASTYNVTTPGLTYSGITNGASGLKVSSVGGGGSARRTLSQVWGEDGTTFYMSVIVQKTIADDATRFWGVQLYNAASQQRLVVGQNSGYANFSVAANVGGSIGSSTSSQTESLLLVRIDAAAGANDLLTFWVNPDFSLSEAENIPAGSKTIDLGEITQIRMGGGSSTGTQEASTHIIDEIRLSTETPFSTDLAPVVESFDYSEGSLDGKDGGSGFATAWANAASYNVTSPGLDYSDLSEGSSGLKVTSIGSGGAARRTLAGVWGKDGTTFYVSTILQKTIVDDNTRYWGLQLYNAASQQKLTIGQNSGSPYYQLNVTGEGSLTSSTSSQTESLLLIRVDAEAGTNDTVTFWVDPDLSTGEEQNAPVGVIDGFDLGEITQIRMGGGSSSDTQEASTHILDEIRISSDTPFGSRSVDIGDITISLAGGTNVVLNWQGMESVTYTVQTRESLVSGSWSNTMEDILGVNGAMSISNTPDSAQAFYRMVAE